MKNTFKKISALVIVLVMVLSLSAIAFAADDGGDVAGAGIAGNTDGVWTTHDTPVTQGTTLKLHKEITAYNPETCVVNAPTITFNYTIASGSADKDIIDDKLNHDPQTNVHVKTKAGVGSPVISSLALTPSNQLDASVNGTANWFDITVDFSGVNFLNAGSGTGVYRYVITETTNATTKNNAGIAEGTIAKTLYLDVYVNGDGSIYGYVLFTNNVNIDATTSAAAAATTAGKIEGFVDDPDNTVYDSSNTSAADKYYTFNLELTKEVVNDTYAETTHHQFPFTVTLTNASVTANVLPIMTVSQYATQTALSTGPIAGTWNPTIADGASVKYVGIPCGTTITVKETNDVVGVTYESESDHADTDAATKTINYGEDSNTATISCGATALAVASENHTSTGAGALTFTNTLLQISPTGVVLRVAPYAAILGAGVLLFAVSRKYSKKDDEVTETVEA